MSSIKVAIRVKLPERLSSPWQIGEDGKTISLKDAKKVNCFDKVFSGNATSEQIYQQFAAPIIKGSLQGINGTIFAYGQTGSGKTYTMTGTDELPGIIPLAAVDIFSAIKNESNKKYTVNLSYFEIYNERIRDLLIEGAQLEQRAKYSHVTTETPEELLSAIHNGSQRRSVGATNMNDQSSRSHSLAKIDIICVEQGQPDLKSTLFLVDLAGSECAAATGATGERQQEASKINQSLLALSKVIESIVRKQPCGFSDSKLTKQLQNSLGGNANTAIICTVSSDLSQKSVSESTLRFASNAMKVKTMPKVNKILTDKAIINQLRAEITTLKDKIREYEEIAASKAINSQELQEITLSRKRLEELTNIIIYTSEESPASLKSSSSSSFYTPRSKEIPSDSSDVSLNFNTKPNINFTPSPPIDNFKRPPKNVSPIDEDDDDITAKVGKLSADIINKSGKKRRSLCTTSEIEAIKEKEELIELRNKVSSYETLVSSLQENEDCQNQEIEKLNEALSESIKENNKLRKEIEALKDQNKCLSNDINGLMSEIKKAADGKAKETMSLKEQIMSKDSDINDLKDRINSLLLERETFTMEEKQRSQEAARNNAKLYINLNTDLTVKIRRLERELNSAKAQIEKNMLRSSLSLSTAVFSVSQSDEEYISMESRLQRLMKENERQKTLIESVPRKYQSMIKESDSEKEKLKDSLIAIKKELEETKSQISKSENKNTQNLADATKQASHIIDQRMKKSNAKIVEQESEDEVDAFIYQDSHTEEEEEILTPYICDYRHYVQQNVQRQRIYNILLAISFIFSFVVFALCVFD